MKPYPNPPIREALIDIKIDPLPQSSLAVLEALHEQVKEKYPTKKARHRWEGSLKIEADQTVSADQRHLRCDGFLFFSTNEKQIVQYRLDGFTFSRLRPYPPQGWPVFREEAIPLWDLYLRAVQPIQVVRIGLRYINQIDVPFSQIDLEEYLAEPPRIPRDLPQMFDHFFVRQVISFPDLEAKAIIIMSTAPAPNALTTSLYLDIDVLTEVSIKGDSVKVWQILDRFREVKNKIFQSSLRPKTEELFR
jgi:uncharacterized protein (TIGR04255 family)